MTTDHDGIQHREGSSGISVSERKTALTNERYSYAQNPA